MITYFDIQKPLRRPLGQPRRQSRRQGGKNGAVDMRTLDGVLQDLGFAPKPNPTIFIENAPEAVFDGLEKFQKSNRLSVDGAVKNKDSETGRALNKAMAEFYVPSGRKQTGFAAGNNGPEEAKLPEIDVDLERKIAEKVEECRDLQAGTDEAERIMDLNRGTPEGERWQKRWRSLLMDVQRCRFALGALRRQRPGYRPEKKPPPKFPKPTIPKEPGFPI